MAISEIKGQGWRAIPTQWRKASDILTSTLATFLFSSHPKKERDREAHLNYYAGGDNSERQLSYCKTKLNQIHTTKTRMYPSPQNTYDTKSTQKISPVRDWRSTLCNWRLWQFQRHVTRKLGQISPLDFRLVFGILPGVTCVILHLAVSIQ